MNSEEDAKKAIDSALERVGLMEYQVIEARALRSLQEEIERRLAERDRTLTEIDQHRLALQQMIADLSATDEKLAEEAETVCEQFNAQISLLQTKYVDHLKKEKARLKSIEHK